MFPEGDIVRWVNYDLLQQNPRSVFDFWPIVCHPETEDRDFYSVYAYQGDYYSTNSLDKYS